MDSSSIYHGLVYASVASLFAAGVTHPIDSMKVRLQVHGTASTSALRIIHTIAKSEGYSVFLWGMNAAVLRGFIYGGIRYPIYSPIKRLFSDANGQSNVWKKMLAGSISGCFTSMLCTPLDLIKVRMQTHGPSVYRSITAALMRIYATEGLRGLFTGVIPTATRATVLAAAELATYDEAKESLLKIGYFTSDTSFALHFTASLLSGLVATAASTPFDFAKSRIMNLLPNESGIRYKGMIDCMYRSAKAEGILVLWSGFWATFARLGPNITITFIIMEQLKLRLDHLYSHSRETAVQALPVCIVAANSGSSKQK